MFIQEPVFIAHKVDGDNSQYAGRKFILIMTLNETDYKHGAKVDLSNDQLLFGEDIQFALTFHKDDNQYLNPAGRMLYIAVPNVENDHYQQFTFGDDEWNTVIDSFVRKGMVSDVADQDNFDPPAGVSQNDPWSLPPLQPPLKPPLFCLLAYDSPCPPTLMKNVFGNPVREKLPYTYAHFPPYPSCVPSRFPLPPRAP